MVWVRFNSSTKFHLVSDEVPGVGKCGIWLGYNWNNYEIIKPEETFKHPLCKSCSKWIRSLVS